MFQRYIRTTSGANQILSVCWIRVNICPRYYKDGHEVLTKGKSALLRIGLGFTCGQRDPELCDRASLTLPLLVIVSDGPLDDGLLCACADRA